MTPTQRRGRSLVASVREVRWCRRSWWTRCNCWPDLRGEGPWRGRWSSSRSPRRWTRWENCSSSRSSRRWTWRRRWARVGRRCSCRYPEWSLRCKPQHRPSPRDQQNTLKSLYPQVQELVQQRLNLFGRCEDYPLSKIGLYVNYFLLDKCRSKEKSERI